MDVDLNEIYLSGIINNIVDNNMDYIKFSLTTTKYDKRKIYTNLNVKRELYEIYKDLFIKGTKVFIKGYLNSYNADNKIKLFITVLGISDNEMELRKGRSSPYIRYDPDGVMVWNGKRCEKDPYGPDEVNEIEELLKEYKQ